MARPKSDPIKRFLAKVVKVESGCHEWISTKHRDGYGKFYYEGKQLQAHRMSYKLFVGPTNGLWVLHKCDNRKAPYPYEHHPKYLVSKAHVVPPALTIHASRLHSPVQL